ncbi:MAG TPA: response regulator [Thauera sp.]|nr:response regulator [Thauera sp.]
MSMPLDAKVLVVDDDVVTRACLVDYFAAEGYDVRESATAEDAEQQLATEMVDLVLLDIRLPRKDGLTLTRELRVRSDVGIILVSGRQDEVERIIGLECGADEYVTKPFNPREILARAKNLIRRVRHASLQCPAPERVVVPVCEGCALDDDGRQLCFEDGEPAALTEGEFQLLRAFLAHPGQTMSRDALLDQIRNREWVPSDRTVDVLVGRLRRKLRDDAANPRIILTVHGAGYRFSPSPRPRA